MFESWSQDVHYLGVTTSSLNDALDDFGHFGMLLIFDLSFDGTNNNVSSAVAFGSNPSTCSPD